MTAALFTGGMMLFILFLLIGAILLIILPFGGEGSIELVEDIYPWFIVTAGISIILLALSWVSALL